MPEYTSGSISIGGLGNGTDFNEMIEALKKIEMMHANKLAKWRDDWQLRLDAFGTLRTELVSLSKVMADMNSPSKFLVKTANVSNPSVLKATPMDGLTTEHFTIQVGQLASNSYASVQTGFSAKNAVINSSGGPETFSFTYKEDALSDTTQTITVPDGTTLEGLVHLINNSGANKKVNAALVQSGGEYILQLYSKDQGKDTDITVVSTPSGLPPSTAWAYQAGQNSMVRVNGFPADPDYIENDSNTIIVGDGLMLNLYSVSTEPVTITLANDTTQIKENVVKFVESVNSVLSTIQELTKVDGNKVLKDPEYATSQFQMQQGSVLTGNYGVQLLNSKLKSLMSNIVPGFDYLVNNPDGTKKSGDTFSSLSQIGIKTDADPGSPTYGLLVFEDPKTKLISFEKALEKDPEGVAELFSAYKKGYSESGDFAMQNALDTTKAGIYEVKYEVDASGNVTGTINGKKAKYYPDSRTFGLIRSDEDPAYAVPNDADGILLYLYDVSPGSSHEGNVRIKDGLLNSMKRMVDVDFLDPDDGEQDTQKGILSVLESQYSKIISNIEEKIAKEDERIIKWERMTRKRFANLEATLKYYDGLMAQVESQVKQLGGNSSK